MFNKSVSSFRNDLLQNPYFKICDKSIYVAKDIDGKFVKTDVKDVITNQTITLPGRPAYHLVRKSKVKHYIAGQLISEGNFGFFKSPKK